MWGLIGWACATSRVRPSDKSDAPAPQPSRVSDSATTRTLFSSVFSPGTISYSYQSSSTVQSIVGDSTPRIDSIHVSAKLAVEFQSPANREGIPVVIRLDSLQVTTVPNASLPTQRSVNVQPNVQRDGEIHQRTGQITLSHKQVPCTQETQGLVLQGSEILPRISTNSPATSSWTDTTTHQLCRGGVALSARRIAHYQLTPETSDPEISYLIRRITESQLTGNGYQWQQTVRAIGRATAIDTFFIARTTTRVMRMSGSTRLEITFESARRSQQFVQISQTQAVAN